MTRKCERCRRELPKRALVAVEGNRDGSGSREERMVCRECLEFDLPADIERFQHRAVVIEPVPKYDKYDFLSTHDLIRDGWSERYVDTVHSLMPDDEARCAVCHRPARFAWVSSAIYRGDPYSEVLYPENVHPEALCAGCVGERLRKALENLPRLPRRLQLPGDADGMWTSVEI